MYQRKRILGIMIIVIALATGMFLKNVKIGLVIGLMLGLFSGGLLGGRRK